MQGTEPTQQAQVLAPLERQPWQARAAGLAESSFEAQARAWDEKAPGPPVVLDHEDVGQLIQASHVEGLQVGEGKTENGGQSNLLAGGASPCCSCTHLAEDRWGLEGEGLLGT